MKEIKYVYLFQMRDSIISWRWEYNYFLLAKCILKFN